jgi:tRNA uridine 5-carbamoylmethylation protein Kti12
MSKTYDTLMRSGNFTAAQNKDDQGEFIDSIGEIVAICEKQGFIPRYYVDEPKDKIDRIIQDMQKYTHDLVTEELGLGTLIENSMRTMQQEKESIKNASSLTVEEADQQAENALFDYEVSPLADEDFIDFATFKEQEANQ